MKPEQENIQGTLSVVKYHQGNFLIGSLDDGTTVKGRMVHPKIGMDYSFAGQNEIHPRWQQQFCFSSFNLALPTGTDAIQTYLIENSEVISPQDASLLIDEYGENTLAVCKTAPDRVAHEVQGVPLHKVQVIAAMILDDEGLVDLHLELEDIFGGTKVNGKAISKIEERWGRDAPARIRDDPYSLVETFEDVSFFGADEVAKSMGFDHHGARRLRAGFLQALRDQACRMGHTCLPKSLLLTDAGRILKVQSAHLAEELDRMLKDAFVRDSAGYIFLNENYDNEVLIAEKLKILSRQPLRAAQPALHGLADDQRDALLNATSAGVSAITGPPGTGKTFAIEHIISSFPEARIALAAPTGKAAKRMTEQTGQIAMTIHRLLEPQKEGDRYVFTRNHHYPIEVDVVIVDEVSMVDTNLMARLLDAIAPGTQLVLVGDINQLPSVGPGNVLKDLVDSGGLPCSQLSIIKRQDEGLIVRNCHRIQRGKDIALGSRDAKDFYFIEREDEESIREAIIDIVARRIPGHYGADPLKDVQVITPLRERTSLSCRDLNLAFQQRLNDRPRTNDCRYKIGDKVIQTKNDYDLNVMNGDIGFVFDIDLEQRVISVEFENPNQLVDVPLRRNELDLAYAITCHKFQGSEAPYVVIPIHEAFGCQVMQRNWLYTAISRAQKVCILVGQAKEIPKIIKRDRQQRRYTRLKELLR